MPEFQKRGATFGFSWEQFAKPNPEREAEFRRTHTYAEPTEQEWIEFSAWQKEYERIREIGYQNEWLMGGYEGDEVMEPRKRWRKNA